MYSLLFSIVGVYAVLLLVLNAVPHLKVGRIGWLSLHCVTVNLTNLSVSMEKVLLRINPLWLASSPFRMVVLLFHGVVVTRTTTDEEIKQKLNNPSAHPDVPDQVVFDVPAWVHEWLIRRRWLNELAVHFYHFSFHHHVLNDEVSFHLDYLKVETLCDFVSGAGSVSVTALDGYVNDVSEDAIAPSLRCFHNSEISVKCDMTFACPPKSKGKVSVCLSNLALLFIFGDLHIRNIPHLMAKKKRNFARKKELLGDRPRATVKPPELLAVLHRLNLIASVQVKFEQSVVEFKEMRATSSSYSFSYYRDRSFKQQTIAKLSSHITSAKIFHLDLKCLEVPALTHILEINLTDVYRAYAEDDLQLYFVDCSTTLNLTNPSVNVFFDQLSYLMSVVGKQNDDDESLRELNRNHNPFYLPYLPYIKRLRKVLAKMVIVDTKATLHMPALDDKNFHRLSMQNVVTNGEMQVFCFKTSSKDLGKLVQRKCSGSKPLTLKGFIKIKNLNLEVEENRIGLSSLNALIGYCVNSNKVGLRVQTKRLLLKSVNTMIFHVVRKVQETRIGHLNKACAGLRKRRSSLEEQAAKTGEEKLQEHFVDLFSLLPSIVCSIKFQASHCLVSVICNDYLPSHTVYDQKLGQEVDLAGFKRGVSFAISDFAVDYKRDTAHLDASLKQVQVSTLSDYPSEHIGDYNNDNDLRLGDINFDDISSMDSGYSGESSLEAVDDVSTVKQVLFIHDISITNQKGAHDKLIVTIPEIDGYVDIFLVWCVMYAHSLVEMISPKVEKTYSVEQVAQLHQGSKRLKLDVAVDSLCVVARVPHDVDLLFEVDSLKLENVLTEPLCQIDYCRLYVVHPATKLWTRFVSIKDTYVNLDSVTKTSFGLHSKSVRINIPFQFLVYTVIDNLITFAKAARQVRHNFEHLSKDIHDYSRIPPEAKDAVILPHVQWKANTFGIILENDAFEAELSLIYELGAVEQLQRKRKNAFFNKKAQELRESAQESLRKEQVESKRFLHGDHQKPKTKTRHFAGGIIDHFELEKECAVTSSITKVFNGKAKKEKASQTSSKSKTKSEQSSRSRSQNGSKNSEFPFEDVDDSLIMTEEKAEEIIAKARVKLDQDFATSWIQGFRRFKRVKEKGHSEKVKKIWGEDVVNKVVRDKFEVQDYAPGPPQFFSVFRDFDLDIDDPEIPDIHEFLRVYGKGQPKSEYSILVPVLLHLRSSSVYMGIKDYVLPLLSFPESESGNGPVMDFKGPMVVNEVLVTRKEELRHIFVPFSPATAALKNPIDNFYSVEVLRTLKPVKMMFDWTCNLATDRACMISWCKAYQPLLLNIMSSFDNFTKPAIDDSPLGAWDKIALIAHGKMRFNIENELCLHIKSSTSPYALVGESSGFVFSWKHNVSLRINDTGNQAELVILESDDFVLAVPNYSTVERKTWSLLQLRQNEHDHLFDADAEIRKFQKKVMKLTSDEKVCWKLGFLFERNVDSKAKEISSNMERTNKFRPHYDVMVTGPQYEYHPDSYERFRSDYLHLAISVRSTSKNGNSHNSAYLTPLTIKYFLAWWKTLNDTISLPIREGKLFTANFKKESLVKFGTHLATFKYQLVLEPLSISHIFIGAGDSLSGHRVISTGIKGQCKTCIIDLHQRREVVRYVNEKLGIDKKVRKLKLNLGEINVTDADIRLIHARFSDVSLRGKLFSYYSGESNEKLDVNSYSRQLEEDKGRRRSADWLRGMQPSTNNYLWLDLEDFVELEEREILSADPVVELHPFFFTPKFTFFREFTLERPGARYPYGNEPSHNCLIGAQSPDKVQAELVENRYNVVKSELEDNVNTLSHLEEHENPVLNKDYQRIKNLISQGEKRMEKLTDIYDNITGGSHPPSIQEFHTPDLLSDIGSSPSSHLSPRPSTVELRPEMSRRTSIYSNYRSLEQARDVLSENASVSEYHNRFLVHNLQMQWNNKVRDSFNDYTAMIGDERSTSLSMSREAVDLVQGLLRKAGIEVEDSKEEAKRPPPERLTKGGNVIEDFDEYLTATDSADQEIEYKYLVKLIRPQIQLLSDTDPDSCILKTSQDIELRVLCVNVAGTDDIISDDDQVVSLLETRYGVLFQDSFAFAFHKSDFPATAKHPYEIPSEIKSWPPWVDLEVCDDCSFHNDNLVVENFTMALSLKKPNMLTRATSTTQERNSEIVVHLEKAVINATSTQYSAFYFILIDLLMKTSSLNNSLRRRIENVTAVYGISEFEGLSEKVSILQSNIRICRVVLLRMDERTLILSEHEKKEKLHLEIELERMKIELGIIIKSLELAGSKKSRSKAVARTWNINADQIIFHLLEDSREPLTDFAFADAKYSRIDTQDGTKSNAVEISMIQGFNLRKDAAYPELLRPFFEVKDDKKHADACKKEEPMVKMTWEMLDPVGGIRVMSNAELIVQPIHVQLDYDTANMLFSYLFPKEEKGKNSKSDIDSSSASTDEEKDVDSGSIGSASTTENSSNPFRKLMARRIKNGDSLTNTSASTRSSLLRDNMSHESSSLASSSESNPHYERRVPHMKKARFRRKQTLPVDELSVIMNRSSKNMVIDNFKVAKVVLCASFLAPKSLNIIDVHNLTLTVPAIHYKDKTWSSHEFASHLKKDIVKVVLSHSGKIIGNKFKHRPRKGAVEPLKQIADYSQYMTLDQLQEQGRARNARKFNMNGRPLLGKSIASVTRHLPVHVDVIDESEVYDRVSGLESDDGEKA